MMHSLLKLVAVAVCCVCMANAAAAPPNVVLIIADDLGYAELGCQGNADIPTPHIDSIARRGVRFTAGYVTAPFCSASRAGLLTGRWQTRFGYEFNPIGHQNEDPRVGLPSDETTLAELLKEAGYATALVGKWHLGGAAERHPLRHGFDEFFGFLHEGHYYLPAPYDGATTMLRRRTLPDGGQGRWISSDGRLVLSTHMKHAEPAYDANNPILRNGQPIEETAPLTRAFSREAVSFIERHRERPFFLCLAYNAVHSPLQGMAPYMERFSHIDDVHRRIFAAMLAELDDGVGAVLDSLREQGLEENTLVVFLSDNGGPTRELTSSNAPLRGEKGSLYEGGVRVPFLMQWPGTIPQGKVETTPALSLDIFATAAAAANVELPRREIDGVNLLPRLTGQSDAAPHETLFWRIGRRGALRHGDWKLVSGAGRGESWELYDLSADVEESRNLAASHADRVRELAALWTKLSTEMQEPAWRP